MKVKTIDLGGAALDWAVAKCEGEEVTMVKGQLETRWTENGWKPSTDWAQGGPIIERELIRVVAPSIRGIDWTALIQHHPIGANNWSQGFGPTPLIAAMRCYVSSKLGDEIETPEELK
jgi:hypothetical protein